MASHIPQVIEGKLLLADATQGETLAVGSPEWYAWLHDERNSSFSLQTAHGPVTVRGERQRNGRYWYAYRRWGGRLRKAYLGRADDLTLLRLDAVAARLVARTDVVPQAALQPVSTTGLALRLLGAPTITREGHSLTLTAAKGVALLGYLALHEGAPTREQLLALLWPESAAAAKNLRNTLWSIRTSLGGEAVVGDERLMLGTHVVVDARRFKASAAQALAAAPTEARALCEQALALYGGELLDGLVVADAPEWELWLMGAREELRVLHTRVQHALLHTNRVAQRWGDVVALAQQALQDDPLQEPLYQALMEAHARLGQRHAALRCYETLCNVLERELGVAPLPATEALRDAIAAGRIGTARYERPTGIEEQPSAVPAPPSVALFHERAAPYIGRIHEQTLLDQAFGAAQAGQRRIVLLTGEVGVGKSRLWQEWRATLPPHQRVLEAYCLPATQTLPFAPLLELFHSDHRAAQLRAPSSLTPPQWLLDVAALTPRLAETLAHLPLPPRVSPAEERRRVFEALLQGVEAISTQPLTLFVDDLHWADAATLDWLQYLVHRVHDQPLLLVAAYRLEETPPQLAQLVASWGRAGLVERLALSRFGYNETAALVTALGGDAGRAAAVYAQSAGNPLFVSELVRALPGTLPPVLGELIHARLGALPESVRQLLQAAAVLQPTITFGALQRVTGRGEDETLDALDALLRGGVLVDRGGYYAFAHPLVAAVIADELSGPRRVVLHRRAAQAREADHAHGLAPVAGLLAAHYQEAGEAGRAAAYADLAAQHALELGAPTEAVRFGEQALTLEPTPQRQLLLGQALIWQGEVLGARTAFTTALAAFRAHGDAPGVVAACLQLATTALMTGEPTATVAWATEALAVTHADDIASRARAQFLLGAGKQTSGQSLGEAEQHLTNAAVLAAQVGLVELVAPSAFELGNVRAQRGDLDGALVAFRDAVAAARACGDRAQEVLGLNNAAYHALLAGDVGAARRDIETALRVADEYGLRMPQQWLWSTRGEVALAEGQWEEAEAWFTRGLPEAERMGNRAQVASYRANLALAARGRGNLDCALVLLEAAHDEAAPLAVPHLQIQIDLWLAEVHGARGERHAAVVALERAQTRLTGNEYGRLTAWAAQIGAVQP